MAPGSLPPWPASIATIKAPPLLGKTALLVSGESSGTSAAGDESGAANSSLEIRSLSCITRPATALSIFAVGGCACNVTESLADIGVRVISVFTFTAEDATSLRDTTATDGSVLLGETTGLEKLVLLPDTPFLATSVPGLISITKR